MYRCYRPAGAGYYPNTDEMAEIGAKPKVPKLQRVALRAVRAFSTPLLPDDYLELINPLWSTRELRGRIERIDHVTREAATVMIKPGYRWEGHRAGQYLRIGVDIRGVRHWRAYSLTSEPGRPDGCISITPKLVETRRRLPIPASATGAPARSSRSAASRATSCSPTPCPRSSCSSARAAGITPIISMLRSLCRQDALTDAVLLHSARTPDEVIFGGELRYLDRGFPGFRLHEQHTSRMGRLAAKHLDELCPDWRERETFASGPGPMLDTLTEHWERHGDPETLHMERFQPKLGIAETGEGGTITFLKSGAEVEADGSKPILVCGEEAGLELPVRLPRGDLPHVRGDAALGPDPGPAKRGGERPGGPIDQDVHQRPRGTSRDRALIQKRREPWPPDYRTHDQNGVANPLARLSDEQLEAIGREFDELHDEVKGDLGDRDARYIRGIIALQRRLALMGRAELFASRSRPAWWLGMATLSTAKILENMEIGHNVMHGQWDWMNDPVINSQTWDWDTASTKEAWKHSHNYIHHTFTNILGKDRDLGYEIMRIDPHQKWHPFYLLQPFYNVLLMLLFEWGVAVHDLDFDCDPLGREVHGAGAQGAQGDRRQGTAPDPEGLRRVAALERRRLDRSGGGGARDFRWAPAAAHAPRRPWSWRSRDARGASRIA